MRGDVPRDVAGWFDRHGQVIKEDPRVDFYVNLGGSTTASVKHRAGRLEFKAMCSPAPAPFAIGDVRGLQNQWVKWSCSYIAREQLDAPLSENGWLAVRKTRAVRQYTFDAADGVAVLPGGAARETDYGCDVELTSLRILPVNTVSEPPADALWEQAPQWWSLAFEAHGRRPQLQRYLHNAAALQLSPPPPLQLDERTSDAYPAWLAAECSMV